MKRTKLWVVALLAVTMLSVACSGGGPSASNAPGASGSAAPSEPYSGKFAEGVEITIGCVDNYLTGYPYPGLPVWNHLEEVTGIKINWETTPSADYTTVMQTRLASGVDLPDFVSIPGGAGNAMRYVQDGIIVPLDDWMNQWGYYTTQFYEQNSYVKPYVTAPDGKTYFYTSDVAGTSLTDPYAYMIREDWLAAVGMDAPVTIDDWYNVWKAFVDQDANGNGQKDEIPWCNDNTLIGVACFGSAWGLYTHASQGWNPGPNFDTASYDWVKPEAKELLTWLNKCYTEGLLDKEFATQSADTMLSKVTNNQSGGVMRFLNGLPTHNNALKGAGIDGQYIVVGPPVLQEGGKQYVERYGPVSGLFGFTKDCTEDVEAKFKFIDYLYASQDGAWSFAMGIEGMSYEVVDGVPQFTDFALNNPDGMAINEALRSIGAMGTVPWARSLNGLWSHQVMATLAGSEVMISAAASYQDFIVDSFPTSMLTTDEEQDVLSRYLTDLTTARDEWVAGFITGQRSLDTFDDFVTTVEGLGLEEVLKVRQAQLDRYNEAIQ